MRTTRFAGLLLASWLSAQQAPTDAELAAALSSYAELGLPLAPASAPLVLLSRERSGGPLRPAFRLAPKADGAAVYLCGTCLDTGPHREAAVEPLARPLAGDQLVVTEWFDDYERDQDLAVGLQLWARGYQEAARALVQRGARDPRLLDRVAQLAAAHWHAQLHESDEPLVVVEHRLRAAVTRLPGAKPAAAAHPFVAPPPWHDLVERLAQAAAPPGPKVDPRTALVLGLVHSRRSGGLAIGIDSDGDAPFDAVVRQGFAIVPALIAHLDDQRLTRARTNGINNMRSYTRPLGELASDALSEIAGFGIQRSGGLAPRIAVADAEAWWSEVRNQHEDEYLVASFLGGPERACSTGAMRILAAKFPERLHLAMLELVERSPERITYEIVDAIADSSMRKSKKVELLERVAATNPGQRLQALRRLATIDEERFCARFVEVLANAPKRTPKDVWISPDANFGHLVVLTPRRDVWSAFVRAARAAEIGLRMEYMNPFAYTYLADRQRNERLACLAAFLDDDEVYDVAASGQTGPHAAFCHEKLAMRDFAARQLAILFGYETCGDPKWTAAQWTELRERVRRSLQQAGVAPMSLSVDAGK